MQTIIYEGIGSRIDIYLAQTLSYSRNFFHHILARGEILVNNISVKKSYQLKSGDQIVIQDLERFTDTEILQECPQIDIPVIYEAKDYLIISKPKGVLSHPRTLRELHEPSVVGFLYHRYKDLPSTGNFVRAGIIHRLDKMTDGLMILIKTEQGLAYFKPLFMEKEGNLEKRYRAKVTVTPQGNQFLNTIEEQLPYLIDEIVVPKVPHAIPKQGKTLIHAIHRTSIGADLDIQILTGRTHQIRYHLSHHGLPIIGDYLYGKDDGQEMQLTAYKLKFLDPEGIVQTFEIPLS